MSRPNRFALVSLLMVLALCAWLSRWQRDRLELQVEPVGDQEIAFRLRNGSNAPVRLYNSLGSVPPGEPPGFTSIRLRNARGELLTTRGIGPEQFWTYELSQTRKVPVVLETLPPRTTITATTKLSSLVRGFDEEQLAQAVEAQVRCVVLRERGLLEARSAWLPLSGVRAIADAPK